MNLLIRESSMCKKVKIYCELTEESVHMYITKLLLISPLLYTKSKLVK